MKDLENYEREMEEENKTYEKEMRVSVDIEDIFEYVKNGKDCSFSVDEWGDVNVGEYDGNNYGIVTQWVTAYDYEECEDEQVFIDWLVSCYADELEKTVDNTTYYIKFMFRQNGRYL